MDNRIEQKYDEQLLKLEASIHLKESAMVVGQHRPTLHDDYNVYVQFDKVEAILYQGGFVPTKQELVDVFADCITVPYVYDVQKLGGALATTMEAAFKTPVGADHVE